MPIKPILFNTEMVQAILDGRKTCTRRVIKPQPDEKHTYPLGFVTDSTEKKEVGSFGFAANEYGGSIQYVKPPYRYAPGDILYVRETWCALPVNEAGHMRGHCVYYYRADGELRPEGWRGKWHPSIHMPKEAARIWLKVTDVRVERLQEIAAESALAEGADKYIHTNGELDENMTITSFIGIWNSTIKKSDLDRYGWDANPWVWVIEFERCEKPEIRDNIETPIPEITRTGLAITALTGGIDALESAEALKNKFIDGMNVHSQGDDADDAIECPFCGYEVAINDDYKEMRPKHCPECGTKLIY